MLASDELRDIYRRLWALALKPSDETRPPVRVLYQLDEWMPMGTAAAFFLRDGDVFDPQIWVGRMPCPSEPWKPDLDRATLRELISLAHERGHELSWRKGTYVEHSMPEEHRAWEHADEILRSMGFTDWDAFALAKEESLAEHRRRGTPA